MNRRSDKGNKRKYKGSKGTISVFLVIILVPCIVLTCLLGDVSRVELSKAEASSASDLAMYSLLSHFDNDLKEYYGLVASCQDIDKFYEMTATYFTGMMNARGISGAGSQMFLDYLRSLREGDISDFLQVEFTKPAEVKAVSDSALADNPALIEDSIVEFMKYRGPYELLKNLITRLENKKVLDGISGADKDEPIVEARKDCAEAEGDMLKQIYYCYVAIKRYTDYFKETGVPGYEKYEQYAQDLKKIAEDFQGVTELITNYYYKDTDKIRVVSFPFYNLNAYIDSYKPRNIGREVKTSSETLYCINKKDLEILLRDIDNTIIGVKNMTDLIAGNCSVLNNAADPTTAAGIDINPVVYCMKVQNVVDNTQGVNLNTLSDNGRWLVERYAQLNAALGCVPYPKIQPVSEPQDDFNDMDSYGTVSIVPPVGEENDEDDLPPDWKSQLQDAMNDIREVYNSCYSIGGSSSYLTLVQRYRRIAEANVSGNSGGLDTVNNVKNRRFMFYSKYMEGKVTIGDFMENVRNKFAQIDTDITAQISNINTAISGGYFSYNNQRYFTFSMDSVKKSVNTYSSKRETWGREISNSGSDSEYAQNEREEYNGNIEGNEKARLGYEIGKLGGKAVDDLKTRLINIRKDMQDYQKAVRNFKYGGSQVTKLRSRDDVINAGRKGIPDQQNELSIERNNGTAAGYYKSLLSPDASNVYKAPERKTGETGNNPDLDKDSPKLYDLMKEQFGDEVSKVDSEIKENEKRNDENKKKANEKKENAQKVDGNFLKGKGDNLSSSHGGGKVNILTGMSSIIDILKNILSGSGDELRDRLYVTEYIMDMFSYSTYNNEGQHRLGVNNNKHYTLIDFKNGGYCYKDYVDVWNTEDKTKTPENQSLTNQPITAKYNQMNLGEVEYILFGNKNLDKNLDTSYKSIFEIREALNLVSGFQNFYAGNNTTARAIQTIADAIMAATAGVVPEALTKCVLIGVLATFESAHDMERLKAGIPVVLYKNSDENWFFSISGDKIANFKDDGPEVKDENGIYYSDYMYFFLLMGVMNNKLYSDLLLRTGDLIQANMRKRDGKGDFDLKKSICYFSIDAELKVKPLLLDLPIARSLEGVDVSTATESSGWCTYKVSFVRGYS